jgi:signal peptidase I
VAEDGEGVATTADESAEDLDTVTDSTDSIAEPGRHRRRIRWALEWVAIIALALSAAFLLRTYCFQTFFIPSTSMYPTLQVGDRIIVSKLSVEFGSINRGDIIVFSRPPDEVCGGLPVNDLVKRVIGLPGEYLKSVGDKPFQLFWSTTPGPHKVWHPIHLTWQHSDYLGIAIPKGTYVPPGYYYMMGDNYQYSCDSRYWGPIPKSLIVGKVIFRIWPLSRIGFL